LITLAGTPATNEFAGTSFVTTMPAATTAPLPMVTPGSKVGIIVCHFTQTLNNFGGT